MNCKQCNQPLAENELFCKNCGHQGPLTEQQKKVDEVRNRVEGVLLTQCKSVMFLIVAICFTVMTLAQVINMLSGGLMGILGGILPAIFMIIATVGLWKSYLAKEKSELASSLKNASIYDQYTNVIYTISIVLLVILMVIMMALVGMGGAALGEMAETDMSEGIFGGIIGIAIGFLIPIVIASIFQKIFANRRKYFVALSQYAAGGNYTAEKAPVIGSCVVGGGSFISGLFSLFATTIISSMIAGLMSTVGEMAGELEGIMEMIQPMLDTMAASAVITGLSNLIYGGYYVVSALWMSNTHKEVLAASDEMNRENAKLSEIETSTRSAVNAYQTEQAVAQKKEREAAEEEAKKAQAALQEQQNAMMQMMMQQMMANGMMAANMAAAAPAAPATPAEEATAEEAPAEEAPAEEAPVEEAPVEEAPVEE